MAFNNSFTAVTGATYTAAQYNTHTRDNLTAIWVYTTAGDIAYASSATALARLGIGAVGQQLGVSAGLPAWVDGVPGIFTTAGDLVYGSAADTAARLALGTAYQHLRVNAGASAPEWAALLHRRQGGDSADFSIYGTNDYTPTNVLFQVGVAQISTVSSVLGSVTVTFPVAFSNKPIVLVSKTIGAAGLLTDFGQGLPSTTQVTIYVQYSASQTRTEVFQWMAIGPP